MLQMYLRNVTLGQRWQLEVPSDPRVVILIQADIIGLASLAPGSMKFTRRCNPGVRWLLPALACLAKDQYVVRPSKESRLLLGDDLHPGTYLTAPPIACSTHEHREWRGYV